MSPGEITLAGGASSEPAEASFAVPLLEVGSAHVWWARPTDASPWLATLFNHDERQRLAALRQQLDRDRFSVGCALVRLLAGTYLGQAPAEVRVHRGCRECGKPHGKPRLVSPSATDLQLSVSHAGDRVVVAYTRGAPIGVDVEPLGLEVDVDALIDLAASLKEARALATLEPQDRARAFMVLWTRKEALLKATGQGLKVALSKVVVSMPGEPPRLLAWLAEPNDVSGVSMYDLDLGPGHVASLAVLGRCTEVVIHCGSALLSQPGTASGRAAFGCAASCTAIHVT